MQFPLPGVATREGRDRVVGVVLVIAVISVILKSWLGWGVANVVANTATIIAMIMFAPTVKGSRQIFLGLAILLSIYAFWATDDPLAVIGASLSQASFILAFFCALATLRHVAGLSRDITKAAVFLAQQPPGRRYTALAFGSQIFALVLNYGAISLLGGMARSASDQEPDPEIRKVRIRRMLQAVHRGFSGSLCWSPLSFSIVISTSVVAGASWGHILLPSIGSALLLTAIGWALDKIFKPRIQPGHKAAPTPEGEEQNARTLLPVLALLLLIAVPALLAHLAFGIEASRAVLLIVPAVSMLWLLKMGPRDDRSAMLKEHSLEFVFKELPSFRGEVVLLAMAGFLGHGAGTILAPAVTASGIDLTEVPTWLLLILPIWLIPLGGQIGMNPILFVSLFGPLLPSPEVLGVAPAAMVMSLTAGWALSAVTSPFTASVLLVARLGDVTANDVSMRWNGAFTVLTALVLSGWVLLLA